MDYLWRPLSVDDTPAWAALTQVVAEFDDRDEAYSAEDLAEELEDPALDRERDTIAVLAADDTLAGYGTIELPRERPDGSIRIAFAAAVHPEHRGRGLGAELVDRLERRCVELVDSRFPGRPALPLTDGTAPGAAALLTGKGYAPVRWFHVMAQRPADVPQQVVAPVATHAVEPFAMRHDEATRQAHLEAFRDHWNFAPPSEQRWQHWFTGARSFRADCSRLAIAADGAVDGYVLAFSFQPHELYLAVLGVRPRARGAGMARAMLLSVLDAARQAGFGIVRLDVDTDNTTSAGRLYESTGFTRERTTVVYQKTG